MEHILDDYAHTNGLREVDTRLKLLLGCSCILIGILSATPYAPLFIGISLGCAVVLLARIPVGIYLRLLTVPVSFAVTSCIVILLLTGGGGEIWAWSVFGQHLAVTAESADLALLLLARTFGGMSALFFIALTTPAVELFGVMRCLRLPQEFIDLSMLIYRYIFILIGEAIAIRNAQVMRHGYTTFRNSISAFSMLAAMLFLRSWEKGEDLLRTMDARCYDGKLSVIEQGCRPSSRALCAAAVYLGTCIALMILPG